MAHSQKLFRMGLSQSLLQQRMVQSLRSDNLPISGSVKETLISSFPPSTLHLSESLGLKALYWKVIKFNVLGKNRTNENSTQDILYSFLAGIVEVLSQSCGTWDWIIWWEQHVECFESLTGRYRSSNRIVPFGMSSGTTWQENIDHAGWEGDSFKVSRKLIIIWLKMMTPLGMEGKSKPGRHYFKKGHFSNPPLSLTCKWQRICPVVFWGRGSFLFFRCLHVNVFYPNSFEIRYLPGLLLTHSIYAWWMAWEEMWW